jgi:hypothetical protein
MTKKLCAAALLLVAAVTAGVVIEWSGIKRYAKIERM